jgi:hypothetical protein
MSYDYASLKTGTVRSLLTKFGYAVTLTRKAVGAYTPGTGPTTTTSTYTGVGVLDGYNKREIDGTTIQAGDVRLYFEGDTAPVIGDTTTLESAVWRVEDVTPISPGNVAVMWELRLRK